MHKVFLDAFILKKCEQKIVNNSSARYYKKRKRFEKGSWKVLKSFWRKKKKQQYGHKQYKTLPEDEKERLAEYRKNIINVEKCFGIKDWF